MGPVRPLACLPTAMAPPLRLTLLLLTFVLSCVLFTACTTQQAAETPEATMETAPVDAEGWEVLFDGSDLDAWAGYAQDEAPAAWQIEDGVLRLVPGDDGGDLVTREAYGDFELALEWKISDCGNSGVFYRADEDHDYIWQTAPELQVIDDACHPDARFPSHRAGSNYDLHAAPSGIVRPAGAWNETRIVARAQHVEHWLNGQKVAEYEQGSEAWVARVAASKFRAMPDYGTHLSGVIGLQDHGDPVWYRDIRIRRLDG